MTKAFLINILVLLGLAAAYYLDLFSWFDGMSVFFVSLAIVIVMFVIAVKVLGNPLKGASKDDENSKK